MNILVVVPWFRFDGSMGGVEVAVKKIFNFIRNKGNRIVILTHGIGDNIIQVGKDDGMPIFSFYARTPFNPEKPIKTFISYLLHFIHTIIQLKKFLNKKNIEISIIFYPSIYSLYFVLLKILFKTKYVVSARGSDIHLEIHRHWINKWAVRILLRHADALVTCSEDLMLTAQIELRKLPKRSLVIHNGIDLNWGKASSQCEFDYRRKYMLTLATSSPVKGADVVIRAFSRIYKQFPDIDLMMAGTGPQDNEIEELIENLGLVGRAIRLGHVDNNKLPVIYKQSLFGIIPSRNEGFSNVLLEFQLFGKAVLATNVGGLPEAITDGYNGYLVPSENVNALADKMSFMLNHLSLCDSMGRNGYKRILEEFTISKTGNKFLDLFNVILSEQVIDCFV